MLHACPDKYFSYCYSVPCKGILLSFVLIRKRTYRSWIYLPQHLCPCNVVADRDESGQQDLGDESLNFLV